MTIIKIAKQADGNHLLESQSHQVVNWMGDEWAIVPKSLETEAFNSQGWCDITIEEQFIDVVVGFDEENQIETTEKRSIGQVVVSLVATEIPEEPIVPSQPTTAEIVAIMLGGE